MELWGAFVLWAFVVFIFGGFNAKDEDYKKSVQKYMAILILGFVILGWFFNSDYVGGGYDEDPLRPADIYNE